MKLTELEPKFKRTCPEGKQLLFETVESFKDAQGIMFLCPHCFRKNGGPVGTHRVLVWFEGRGAPPEYTPAPRWQVSGSSMDDLTIKPSIRVNDCWHGFITNGEATFC